MAASSTESEINVAGCGAEGYPGAEQGAGDQDSSFKDHAMMIQTRSDGTEEGEDADDIARIESSPIVCMSEDGDDDDFEGHVSFHMEQPGIDGIGDESPGGDGAAENAGSTEPKEYTISLDRTEGADIGVATTHEYVIDSIEKKGLVELWNTTHPEQKVELGDIIIEVNGKRGDVAEMRLECEKKMMLEIKLQKREVPSYDIHRRGRHKETKMDKLTMVLPAVTRGVLNIVGGTIATVGYGTGKIGEVVGRKKSSRLGGLQGRIHIMDVE
jgi:hypothetical protein